jgi:predicted aldo/keto reductase-like oxidoreductase
VEARGFQPDLGVHGFLPRLDAYSLESTEARADAQCLHNALSQPVATAVSGARIADELRAALQYLEAADAQKDYGATLTGLHGPLAGHCMYCEHCLPCPQRIEMGWITAILNLTEAT